jgi:hypothetical protein
LTDISRMMVQIDIVHQISAILTNRTAVVIFQRNEKSCCCWVVISIEQLK